MKQEGLQMVDGTEQCAGARHTYEVCFNSWLENSRWYILCMV